jgi:hypothetical protein
MGAMFPLSSAGPGIEPRPITTGSGLPRRPAARDERASAMSISYTAGTPIRFPIPELTVYRQIVHIQNITKADAGERHA